MKIVSQINNLPTYRTYLSMINAGERFLEANGFLKVEVPSLSPSLIPEGYLEVFKTEYVFGDKRKALYLTPSPELFIKRLLSEGIGDCYFLGKSYRNSEPPSSRHHFEFTMLEIYKVGIGYRDMAGIVLSLLRALSESLCDSSSISYQNKTISFERWEEMTVEEAFDRFAGIDATILFDERKFLVHAKGKGYQTEGFSYEDLWTQIYAQEVEPQLGTRGYPTLLYDFPLCFAPLSKPSEDGKTAERFEFYIEGLELGNCYSELTDPTLLRQRTSMEQQKRKKSGRIEHPVDGGFAGDGETILPKSAGIAIGLERLGMIFTDSKSIEEVKLLTISS